VTAFLFVAAVAAPFGEVVCGRRLALAAHAAGHRVAFLHTSQVAPVFDGAPFPRGVIDDVLPTLGAALRDAVRTRGFDVVVLVDALATFGVFGAAMRALIASCGTKVVALDLWSCHETSLSCDMGDITTRLDPVIVELPSLRPAPVARPEAPGAYRGLPDLAPLSAEDRVHTRASLGIGAHERVIFTATGAWQAASKYPRQPSMHRLAEGWPSALGLVLRRLGPVRVLHVGPTPLPLGDGYVHVPQVPPAEFHRLLGASDVTIGNNVMATSIASALALDIPSVVIGNSRPCTSLTDASELAPDVRAWLTPMLPLGTFAVLPLGLHDFVAPVLGDNPFIDAIDRCELLDPDATARRVTALLDGDPAKRAARASYRARIATLPSGLDRLVQLA